MDATIITLDFFSTLAQSIAKNLSLPLYLPHIEEFADGELRIDIQKDQLTTQTAILVHSICPPVHDNFMKFALAAQALHAHGIKNIIAVIPYLGYARQMDDGFGLPGAAHMIVRLIEATGIKQMVTCAVHDPAILKLFTIPVHHLTLEDTIIDHARKVEPDPQKICCVAPDQGAHQRVINVAKKLNCGTALYTKKRIGPNEPKILSCQWECAAQTALIIDDIIDTGTTMLAVAHDAQNRDIKEIYGFGIHPVFSRDACARIEHGHLKKLFVCNTIERAACASKKIEVIDVGPYIAKELKKL